MDVVERFKVNRDKGRASGCISLMEGIPGVDTLKPCREILQKATTHLLDSELNTSRTFAYGPEQGDEEVRRVLASFLTEQYGHEEPVDADKIILTAGATQGAHLIATLLFGHGTTCFIEDPTYFIMHKMLSEDLKMNLIPVKLDSEGMDVEELDKLLTQHKPDVIPEDQLYWSFIYSIPVYHNPTGISYSPERCRALIECARKHKVLIIAEDVYNLLCYNTPHPPKRLIAYDNPSDPNYYGSVVSNGTFSKILAPCFRLGWIEGPDAVVQRLVKSFVAYSGGSFNHFGSLVASSILKLNLLQPHIESLKKIYGVISLYY
ncbi:hypothetical protein SNE40_001471 [Patella caerulea]|uniref:Aminotransferase class I/classII large domain-containing protein n=1 Tax=Patella caerulea TaxID=87958 RepID=A0AAN8K773_PATCE